MQQKIIDLKANNYFSILNKSLTHGTRQHRYVTIMINKEEIKKALYRSGYLLESRVSSWFFENAFFVEPNFTFYDSLTQKSREIDLFVENTRSCVDGDKKITCNTYFIIETINNDRPIVFFSNRKYIDEDNVFSQINYLSQYPGSEDDFMFLIDYRKLHYFNNIIATQYCSFQEKKKSKHQDEIEWMAYHPEDLYDNFRKLLFCSKTILDNCLNILDDKTWHRLFRYQPVLVINNSLLEAEVLEKDINLIEKKMISFSFNHTLENEHYSMIIDVITEDYLSTYIDNVIKEDEIIFDGMLKIYDKRKM